MKFESEKSLIPDKHRIDYIGNDGKFYQTPGALNAANDAYFRRTHFYISRVTGRTYPPTDQGKAQMHREEASHITQRLIPHK